MKEESVEVLDVDDDVEFVGASSSSTMTPPKKLNTKQNSPSLNHHSGGNNQLAQNCMSPPSTPPSSSTLPSQQQGGVFQTSLANNLPSAVTLAAQQHGIDPVSFMTTMHQAQQSSTKFIITRTITNSLLSSHYSKCTFCISFTDITCWANVVT